MFVENAKRIEEMGCDSVCIKDMAGLLAPYPAEELFASIKAAVNIPVHLHTHTTSGYALMTITKAIEAGIDGIDTSISPLSMGTSHSPTETIVSALRDTDHDTGFDMDTLVEIANYFDSIKGEYSNFLSAFTGVDVNILKSQIPGGMLSNLESQLKQQNAYDRLPEVMEELPRTRKDMGYPPLVTPTSQIVGTQAVLNVLMGRFKNISKESAALIEGMYGKVPGEIDEELRKKVCGDKMCITGRPADLLKPEWDKLKEEVKDKATKDEDVIIYALFPQVADKYLANRGKPSTEIFKKEEAAPAAKTASGEATNRFHVTVNGKGYDVQVDEMAAGASVAPTGQAAPATASATPAASSGGGAGEAIPSPLSGSVWKVQCAVGDSVTEGDTIIILEAMKMETEIKAPKSGTIQSIGVKEGDSINAGDTLVTIG